MPTRRGAWLPGRVRDTLVSHSPDPQIGLSAGNPLRVDWSPLFRPDWERAMPWLFLLLGAGAFTVAFTTHSNALMIISLIAALVFVVLWLMTLLSQRIGNTARSDVMMIDPQELRRLREQAEARRNGELADTAGAGDLPHN